MHRSNSNNNITQKQPTIESRQQVQNGSQQTPFRMNQPYYLPLEIIQLIASSQSIDPSLRKSLINHCKAMDHKLFIIFVPTSVQPGPIESRVQDILQEANITTDAIMYFSLNKFDANSKILITFEPLLYLLGTKFTNGSANLQYMNQTPVQFDATATELLIDNLRSIHNQRRICKNILDLLVFSMESKNTLDMLSRIKTTTLNKQLGLPDILIDDNVRNTPLVLPDSYIQETTAKAISTKDRTSSMPQIIKTLATTTTTTTSTTNVMSNRITGVAQQNKRNNSITVETQNKRLKISSSPNRDEPIDFSLTLFKTQTPKYQPTLNETELSNLANNPAEGEDEFFNMLSTRNVAPENVSIDLTNIDHIDPQSFLKFESILSPEEEAALDNYHPQTKPVI